MSVMMKTILYGERSQVAHPNEGQTQQGSLLMIVCHDLEGDEDDDEVNGGDDHHDHGDDNDERSQVVDPNEGKTQQGFLLMKECIQMPTNPGYFTLNQLFRSCKQGFNWVMFN